jgi:hypothetical protein
MNGEGHGSRITAAGFHEKNITSTNTRNGTIQKVLKAYTGCINGNE